MDLNLHFDVCGFETDNNYPPKIQAIYPLMYRTLPPNHLILSVEQPFPDPKYLRRLL
jgi:hypothetical protein